MLELYPAAGFPYSQKVPETLTELGGIDVIHNPRLHRSEVWNEQTHEELLELGGQDQIPFLVDHHRGVTIYESNEIVEYLQGHSGLP